LIRFHPGRAARSIAAALALLAVVGGFAGAQAAPAPKFDPPTPAQVTDAKAQIAATGAACEVGRVRFLGTGTVTKNKKETEIQAYEVTCTGGFGYMVQGPKGGSPDSLAQSCPGLKASRETAAKKEQFQVCQFPENQNVVPVLQALVTKQGLACTVAKYRWEGVTTDHHEVYEVSCAEPSPGYVLTVSHGADPAVTRSCLRDGGAHCTLTTPEQQTAWIAGIAAKSGLPCQVTKARWVGSSKSEPIDYYEVGCAAGVGFLIATDPAANFKRAIPCAEAGLIGDGCALSDKAAIKATAIDSFSARLKALGIPCAMTNARVIGKETRYQREVVEYGCSDRPVGLIVVLPNSERPKSEQNDCISAPSRFETECQFTPREKLNAVLTAAMTAGGQACAVNGFKWHGSYSDDTTSVEVSCSGAPGYLTEMALDYAKARKIETCAAAAKEGDPCVLPGNKAP
jgi:hypothetical protein